jgi:hypothetical protein
MFNSISHFSSRVSILDKDPEIYKPDSQHIIKLLKQHNKNNQHPRLMATSEDFENIKLEIHKDKTMRERFNYLKKQADTMLKQKPVKYELPDKVRLLPISRTVLNRVQALAFIYQITNEKKYADRAWLELETISNYKSFPDWHPVHFLDTAEMTNAAAIGYDWLYDYLSNNQKLVIRNAILTKGLKPAIDFSKEENSSMNGDTNWNSVCNAGIGLGALAIGDEGGEFGTISGQVLENAIKYLPRTLTNYAPDGGWYEGPGYWDYGTTYCGYFISSLDSALNTDYNLSKASGLSSTGNFPIYLAGSDGMFNFSDSGSWKLKSPVLLWLSDKFKNGEYSWYYDKVASIKDTTAITFIWGNKKAKEVPIKNQDKYFRKLEVVGLHSSINKNTDSFIGFKAGSNNLSHGDLDIGTFVYDTLGVRWFSDLGSENYNLPGYWNMGLNGQRWQYYRKRAEGHNTLVINPNSKPDQDVYAKTNIENFKSSSKKSFAIANITDAYKTDAISVERGVALYKNTGTMLIQDEIVTNKSSDIWWFAHTQAKIEISEDKKSAILSNNGKKILVSILSPSNGYFEKMTAEPLPSSPNPPNQTHNNMDKLAIHLNEVDDTTISVAISPLVYNKNLSLPNLVKLQNWDTNN